MRSGPLQAAAVHHEGGHRSVLIIDSDHTVVSQLARRFAELGFAVSSTSTAEQALGLACTRQPRLIVLELLLDGKSMLPLIPRLKLVAPAARVAIHTAFGSVATAMEAISLGAAHYSFKLTDPLEIVASCEGLAAGERRWAEDSLLFPSLDRNEWEHINRALRICGGNITEAAKLLRVPRRTLQRKLKKQPPA